MSQIFPLGESLEPSIVRRVSSIHKTRSGILWVDVSTRGGYFPIETFIYYPWLWKKKKKNNHAWP
jgi:hypothetical protein